LASSCSVYGPAESDTQENRRLFGQLLLWSGIAATIFSVIHILYPTSFEQQGPTLASVFAHFALNVQQTTFATFILAAVTLVHWRRPTYRLFPKLAETEKWDSRLI
jgi:hypothetical protein